MASASARTRELGQLRVEALRDACQQRGLLATGRKDQLMARLIEADKVRPVSTAAQKRKGLSPLCPAAGAAGTGKVQKNHSSAPLMGKDKVGAHARCPTGHPLVPFTTTAAGCCCDKCSKSFPKGTQLHSCRKCNYDQCGECLSKAQSHKKSQAQGVGKKAVHAKSADVGILAPAPASPKNAGTSSSSQRGLACDWMTSPIGKRGFESPGRESQSQNFPQSPGGMARRRIREKSPNPHRHAANWRDELGFLASPACRHTAVSPGPLGPRRRIREKSPNPHRYETDWMNSPAAWHEDHDRRTRRREKSPNPQQPLTPGRRLRSKTPERQLVLYGDACASSHQDSRPLTTTAAACGKTPVDPVQALLLLSRRELLEMCDECGVSQAGAKSVLIDRLVEAHHRGPEACPEPEVHRAITDVPIAEGAEGVPSLRAAPSSWTAPLLSSRHVRAVPPPPSSWTAPALPSSWTSLQASEPALEAEASSSTAATESVVSSVPAQVAQSEPVQDVTSSSGVAEPRGTSIAATTTAEAVQIGSSPTPSRLLSSMSSLVERVTEKAGVDSAAEVALKLKDASSVDEIQAADVSSEMVEMSYASSSETTKASAGSANDWWRNVASRWPSIVANLKAGAGGQKDAAPSSPQASPKKRAIDSPPLLNGFQSPKRHCSRSSADSPAASGKPISL